MMTGLSTVLVAIPHAQVFLLISTVLNILMKNRLFAAQ